MLVTTGAEAVENAVKMASAFTGRSGVISFSGGFHGRTLLGMALTGKVAPYKKGFGAMPPEIVHAPFPNEFHGMTEAEAVAHLERLLASSVDPERVAAIIIEPVQGEGGFTIAPAGFLRALRAICDRHGIVLIADEVQAGMARTGRMFGFDHSGVAPDLVTMAKGLAGGFPLSAVTGRAESRGLILLACGTRYNVIRLLPPLTIPPAQLDEALDIIEASIKAAAMKQAA